MVVVKLEPMPDGPVRRVPSQPEWRQKGWSLKLNIIEGKSPTASD